MSRINAVFATWAPLGRIEDTSRIAIHTAGRRFSFRASATMGFTLFNPSYELAEIGLGAIYVP